MSRNVRTLLQQVESLMRARGVTVYVWLPTVEVMAELKKNKTESGGSVSVNAKESLSSLTNAGIHRIVRLGLTSGNSSDVCVPSASPRVHSFACS